MKLKFKHQPFQADAARAVTEVFDGQQILAGLSRYKMDVGANVLNLDDDGWKNAAIQPEIAAHLLERIRKIQRENWIKPSQGLEGNGINLTVEMETGVGKTYTYIKTIHELYRKYGWMKYIVVVPSIAIREGVAKSFRDLEEHFREDYHVGKSVFVYNSSRLGEIDIFAKDSGIHVMIINAQAFASNFNEERNVEGRAGDKAARIIYTPQDTMGGRKPIDVIAAMNPIVIIDEPQSVEGPATVAALRRFKPLFTLRYSATHRQLFNLVYRLDAVDALRQRLVKKIAVKGITQTGVGGTDGYLSVEAINAYADKAPDVTLRFDAAGAKSVKRAKAAHAGVGFDVYAQSGNLAEYDPQQHGAFVITDIDAKLGYVDFRNGLRLFVGQENGNDAAILLRRIQIRETVRTHLEREEALFRQGIKCLSLFFIDEVAKYRLYGEDGAAVPGQYAKIFEEEYEMARRERLDGQLRGINPEYEAWLAQQDAAHCHNGYFSIDKQGHLTDPSLERGRGRRNADEADSNDANAFELIMKGKEKLLSFDDPEGGRVRFIFSHSALREGWDNPNVFQICTLKQSGNYIRKRQEVGRGLRLCVNRFGDRQDQSVLGAGIYDVNTLTVIASESYEDFARDLQRAVAENVGDRPIRVDATLFEGVTYQTLAGEERTVDDKLAQKINFRLISRGYVDENGQITEKYKTDLERGTFTLGDDLDVGVTALASALDQVVNPDEIRPDDDTNAARQEINYQRLNSREFQALWAKINAKSAYTVTFDSQDLVRKSIAALDEQLRVPKITIKLEEGEQKVDATPEAIRQCEGMEATKGGTHFEEANFDVDEDYRCDLVGEVVSATGLTRRDVAAILAGIRPAVFAQFRWNPEAFIRKASALVNEQKANVIVEHITYDRTNETYSQDIFSDGRLKAFPGRRVVKNTAKGVYDKFILDSEVEESFCRELESVRDVVVYTKMPRGFYIDTPVGKYNPDWAIVFDAAGQRHVYFVAETKGSVREFDLNKIEAAKIRCARRHFAAIAPDDVKYGFVATYADLRALLTSV